MKRVTINLYDELWVKVLSSARKRPVTLSREISDRLNLTFAEPEIVRVPFEGKVR